jgi:hypothetical protein
MTPSMLGAPDCKVKLITGRQPVTDLRHDATLSAKRDSGRSQARPQDNMTAISQGSVRQKMDYLQNQGGS